MQNGHMLSLCTAGLNGEPQDLAFMRKQLQEKFGTMYAYVMFRAWTSSHPRQALRASMREQREQHSRRSRSWGETYRSGGKP